MHKCRLVCSKCQWDRHKNLLISFEPFLFPAFCFCVLFVRAFCFLFFETTTKSNCFCFHIISIAVACICQHTMIKTTWENGKREKRNWMWQIIIFYGNLRLCFDVDDDDDRSRNVLFICDKNWMLINFQKPIIKLKCVCRLLSKKRKKKITHVQSMVLFISKKKKNLVSAEKFVHAQFILV